MNDRKALKDETLAARAKAQVLLGELLKAKTSDAADVPKDMYKQVTGASSLENAISATRRLLEAHDRLLCEIAKEEEAGNPPIQVREGFRPAFAPKVTGIAR